MDLNEATWMVRSLDESVSSLLLTEDNQVLAGGWDGRLVCWDQEGTLRWSAQTNDRINSIACNGATVVVASGLHVVALDWETGEQQWSKALEGSADEVCWWQGDIMAISSVYDIEHNDFIESAVWRFSERGDELWVERMDERPWVMVEVDETLYAGLGRPKCGLLDISAAPPFPHSPPPTSSPTTCGTGGRNRGLFGQTDGTVVTHKGDVISTETGSVEHLTCMVSGFVATTDEGHAVGRTPSGEECWTSKGNPVSAQVEAMVDQGASMLWLARNDGVDSTLEVWATDKGGCLASGKFSRIRSMSGHPERAAIGCEDGTVVVWERELLQRRLSADQTEPSTSLNERESALQAKLRALRG
jgi:hypothetical protein